jgi:tRNA(His) guanylyltransferase
MNFDDLEERMRVYETAHDHNVLPGMFMVARLDGRGFTRLTKGPRRRYSSFTGQPLDEPHRFDAPFDPRFSELMVHTTRHLMERAGFAFTYGHTHSDEISLLFPLGDASFGRKLRKLVSVLAGEASAAFSLRLGFHAVLDCRISQLPRRELVVDYFRWRQADAHRNALSAHCYWVLRKEGATKHEATAEVDGRTVAEKNELLFARGINFDELPAWHKRGVGLWWERYEKRGTDPRTGAEVPAMRRRLREEAELPFGAEYEALVTERVAEAEAVAG